MKSAVPIVLGVVVLMGYLMCVHMRDAVQDEIMREESRAFRLQEELQRENANWAKARTPQTLAVALAAHGVAMALPRSSQRVAMAGRVSLPATPAATVYAANR
ncbi:MAG: hypothetical protein IJS46_02375 [Kiritimatiellae bacterium]|nr:hypothetical protein [Kiritimatiellia bacterium]